MVTPIMAKGGAKVPGVDDVAGPSAPDGGVFMHQYHGARRRHRSGIEVVDYVEEDVGEKF